MKKQTNILLMTPNRNDATSFYRGFGPFSHLRRNNENINIIPGDGISISWSTLAMVDIVVMQRPYSEQHLQLAKMVKDNNVKLWLDYDDDLFQVPSDNPAYDLYANEKTQMNIGTMIAMADVVTTSTPQLKVNLLKLNSNIRVIPNAIDEQRIAHRRVASNSGHERNNVIMWRGSDTHVKDISTYGHVIRELIEKTPKWVWVWIGHKPWYLLDGLDEENGKKIVLQKAIDTIEYFKTIQKIKPSAIHVPLHESMFNLCKSNIAYLEGVFAGAIAVVPDWAEWKLPGALCYNDDKGYQESLENIINGEIDISRTNRVAWEYVQDNFLLEKVNEKRKQVIESLRG